MGYIDAELSVLIVDDEEMADINREFRSEDSPTDVLSFPMWEGEYGAIHAEMIGDVVISAPTAERMSKLHRTSLSCVIDLLLVHGILHLVGLDHEKNEEEAARMEEKTIEVLGALGRSATDYDWYMR